MEVKSDITKLTKKKILNKAIREMAAKIKRYRGQLYNQRKANRMLASKIKKSEDEKAGLLSQMENKGHIEKT
eukprot:UN24694